MEIIAHVRSFLVDDHRARSHMQNQRVGRKRLAPVVAMTTHSPISLPLLISSNNRTFYDRHQLLWSVGMMARALTARSYSLGLVWRRGGRWRAPADCWQSQRRDRPMSGRVCCHGVTQQLLCCGQGLWSASGSGTVLCMGAKKTDPLGIFYGRENRAWN